MLCNKCGREKAPRGSDCWDFYKKRELCWNGEWPRIVPMGVGDIIDQAVADCEKARRALQCVTDRSILDSAIDPKTGWVWVCYGGSDEKGWHWAAVGHNAGTMYSVEFGDNEGGNCSFLNAIKAGVTKAVKQ